MAGAKKMNQTIIRSLKLTCKDQTDWDQNITPVLMAYRATMTLPTGISPHYAVFGRERNLRIDSELTKEVETAPVIHSHTSGEEVTSNTWDDRTKFERQSDSREKIL